MTKEELTKFLAWYRKYQYRYQNESEELTINHYTDFVNSTRRSERRADGSNSKAKEVCLCSNNNCLSHKGIFCMANTWKCNDRQTD